jgi:hypothetical protein
MAEVLILCTWWENDYWENDKIAPYPKRSIRRVQHLKKALPIAGIGIYSKGRGRDFSSQPPCWLIIRNIDENEKGEPLFDFHYISKIEGITSSVLLREIGIRKLFFTIPQEKILDILIKFDIEPPSQWQKLLEIRPSPSWLEWIGEHYQRILGPISNNQFEDRTKEIFNALGFEVEQMGHKKEGEYPDGIIYSKDFAIVYDCKNRSNYFLNANDTRAIIRYVKYAKRRIEEQRGIERIYFAIIAHSYDNVTNISRTEKETASKGFLLTSESLLYLLFKKLSLGRLFLLVDFEELISNKPITIKDVDKIYRG